MDDAYVECKGAAGIAGDVQVYGKMERNHDINLHETLERTWQVGIKLNNDKCQVKSISHVFWQHLLQLWSETGSNESGAIQNIYAPTNEAKVHTLLGMINYLRQYILNLSEHTALLRELLREETLFQWTPSHGKALSKLKELVNKNTTLKFYDRTKPVILQVDASTNPR